MAGYQKGLQFLNYKLKDHLFRFWQWGTGAHMHIIIQHITILFFAKFFIFIFFLTPAPLPSEEGTVERTLIIYFKGIKKASRGAEGFCVYFKNLKLCNSAIRGSFRHHTTHIANSKFHFYLILI